jgi:glucosylceramidase
MVGLGPGVMPVKAVNVWVTSGDKTQLLKQQTDVLFQPGTGSGGTAISVVPTTTYQAIDGFGAAMTDSSAWLLQNKMSAAQRDKLMRQIFSPTSGIGLNYLRVPFGASDFTASGFYSYNDNPLGGTDAPQDHFSIAHDQAYIIPRLQQALALNPQLKLMGSPWSAPGWMKTSGSMYGTRASLKTSLEASYATYLKKSVQAYAAVGLPIDTLSLQNEPLNPENAGDYRDYPTMYMTAAQQTNIIKNNLGPMFAAEGIATKILAYDHNWDVPAYPLEVLNDPVAGQYVAGSAFHAYGGTVSAQTTVHNAYPEKGIYFTEISGGAWATNFSDNLVWYMQNIFIGNTLNWGKNALLWNLALDQNYGPHQGGCTNCRGVVTINNSTGAVTFNEEFYAIGQFTKVVQPGAVRIASTFSNGLNNVAFRNPDGSRVLIALNANSTATSARILENGQYFSYPIPAKSVVTFRWDNNGADFSNGGFDDGGFQQGGGSLDAWTSFGDTTGNVTASTEAVLAGDKSLKLFGRFTGGSNVSGAYQGITVAPGDHISASLNAYVRALDSIAGTSNSAQMKIEYYSQYGGVFGSASFLSEEQLLIADGSTPNNVWNARSLSSVAPAGAVEARLVLQFLQPNNQSGAVHIDSVSLGIVPPVAGDFDGNGTVDFNDYAVWRSSYGATSQLRADANNNGMVDTADYIIWRTALDRGPAAAAAMAAFVPEPNALLIVLSGFLTMVCRTVH